mmetsp:Transcript_73008/g.237382  ORF Transcript_73008/g.237382 Transcript_73008/m.237382 type:complete len:223 (+) Transcript_73008:2384-3052(+)
MPFRTSRKRSGSDRAPLRTSHSTSRRASMRSGITTFRSCRRLPRDPCCQSWVTPNRKGRQTRGHSGRGASQYLGLPQRVRRRNWLSGSPAIPRVDRRRCPLGVSVPRPARADPLEAPGPAPKGAKSGCLQDTASTLCLFTPPAAAWVLRCPTEKVASRRHGARKSAARCRMPRRRRASACSPPASAGTWTCRCRWNREPPSTPRAYTHASAPPWRSCKRIGS